MHNNQLPPTKRSPGAAIYVRVSTHHQVDRDSLPFQRSELENYCKYALNIEDYHIFEDAGYSAKNTDRPKYQEMMSRIRAGEFSHLLVWKLDRISRNLLDFTKMWVELQDRGITFVSKMEQFDTSTAMGEAMVKIILVFAELERKLTAERVMGIMLSRAEKGLWNGAPVPIGYDWDEEAETVVINEQEAETVKIIYNHYEESGSSGDVLYYLELHNLSTKRGGKWTTKTISDVLRSPVYKGTLRYNYRESGRGRRKDPDEWVLVDDAVPAIVTVEQWERVQKQLDANFRGARSKRERAKHTHVFSGLIYCSDCEVNYLSSLDRARSDGYKPSVYRCRNYVHSKKAWRKCDGYVSDVALGPFIFSYLSNLVAAEELLRNNPKTKMSRMERRLLKGSTFNEIAGLEAEGLSETCNGILEATGHILQQKNTENGSGADGLELERLKQSKQKHERAMERLERAYLFDDGGMAEKDYLIKRSELKKSLVEIVGQLKEKQIGSHRNPKGVDFIRQASKFLLGKKILSGKADFLSMARGGGREILKDFVNTVIERIEIRERNITAIRFAGGITHRFLYRVKVET